MRARYNQGEHANSPWSGPWQEASLAVAAEPTPEPTAEPTPEPTAEPTEEPESGAIGSPTATDDNAGGLVIAWQAPQAPHDAPTDYRVNWARSDDDYPSYTEEHGNSHPATPTHTLEGLDRDTKYKIRIRARYSPNDRYDAHWSGPWTEITARVVSSPPDTRKNSGAPAAPTLIGTAVTPEGHVTLLWLDPSDDSITGYRVLRGPDADSLAVIQEDTGSTAISYTDTEPPAGQTHAYAVQARSAAGLSPLSNTRTATVPQNEEEEEPVAVRQQTVTTLVTNLDLERTNSFISAASNFNTSDRKNANSFTTAAGPWVRYELSGIRFRAKRQESTHRPTPLVTVHRDDGGRPAADPPLYTLEEPGDFLSQADTAYREYTFTAPPGAILDAGATYWVVFEAANVDTAGYGVGTTNSTVETGEGWLIGDQSLFYLAVYGDWRPNTQGPAQFAVLGTREDLLETETCTVDLTAPGTAVEFLDARLQAVVEAKLGKSSGATITRGEMAGLASLLNTHNKSLTPTPHAQITNMEGLQYATGLTHLSLQRHRIDNAGLIDFCALTKLTKLFLNNNQLTSITIPSLPRLTSLSLSSNRLDSVTILYTPELTYLDLSSNHLSRVIIPPQPKLLDTRQ